MKPLRVLYPLWWIKTKIRMKNVTLILTTGAVSTASRLATKACGR